MIKHSSFKLFAIASIFLAACSDEQPSYSKQEVVYGSAIVGQAIPVRLDYDKTLIMLGDFVQFPEKVDSVYFTAELDFTFLRDSGTVRVEQYLADEKVAAMGLVYEGVHYHIPIFKNRSLPYHFSYESPRTDLKEVGLKGNFNGWNHKANILNKDDDTWTADLVLAPGLYEYLIVENGKEILDRTNPNKKPNSTGGFNSTFEVGSDAGRPLISTHSTSGDSILVNYGDDLYEPLILWENHALDTAHYRRNANKLSIAVPKAAAKIERSYLRVYGSNSDARANDLLIPLQKGKPVMDVKHIARTDKHSYAMYFMMVDRFVNGNTENDLPVNDPEILPPANYYGGDIEGVLQKTREGYFTDLGMNTIWLSPITQNPLGAYGLWDKGGVVSKFSGYHGYWPISSSKVDFRFGTEDELKELITAAHKKDANIILDYVANHVHQEHPVYLQHPEWATNLYLPDSSLNTERWDEYRLTTWFDTFMPTLDLENPEVVAAMTDSALFWFENYDIDGFRHDATKHIALGFWRELTHKLKYRVAVPQERSIYQIGETYGNPELIASYISSGMLDAQFDFNLYDAAVAAFADERSLMTELDRVIGQSLIAYGNHHLMGNISGNQDRTRFISYADGSVEFSEDPKLAGWTRPIEIKDEIGYNRLAMLHALNFTLPGIPVIYYGDEIGMPGANDPDNRRMMRFGDDLSPRESEMLDVVTRIANLRKANMSLLYGDLEVIHLTDSTYGYCRNYFDQTAIVLFNKSMSEVTLEIDIPQHISTSALKANFGSMHPIAEGVLRVTLAPATFEILTR